MYSFKNDYSEGAHSNILHRLIETNLEQQPGYSEDEYSSQAKIILKNKLNNPNASIFFLSGGTQSNLIVIASLLRMHEAVISAKTGHIFANETGAIEATGHRIITVDTTDGKLTPEALQVTLNDYSLRPHVVKPRMVYISNSTEIGTIYHKSELIALYNFCQQNKLLLYMDGARLGHALTATNSNLTLTDIAAYTDVFYIGGTKNGALLGEAVIFNKIHLSEEFDYILKQKGALLSKSRLIGIQFLELFKNDLYFELAKHANSMAQRIAEAFSKKGYRFLTSSTTNQIFPILTTVEIAILKEDYDFYIWRQIDDNHAAIRLITSWATPEEIINNFIRKIQAL